MAISTESTQDNKQYASNGKGNAALTLGIIGTALGAMNNGILGGNGSGLFNTRATDNDCVVGFREYAADQIALQKQMCELAQRVAVNETANVYQNKLDDVRFANVDTRFATEQIINDLTLKLATCNVIKGKPMITELGSAVRLGEGVVRTTPVGYAAPILDTYDTCGC